MNNNIFDASILLEEVKVQQQESDSLQNEIEKMAACDCEVIPEIYY